MSKFWYMFRTPEINTKIIENIYDNSEDISLYGLAGKYCWWVRFAAPMSRNLFGVTRFEISQRRSVWSSGLWYYSLWVKVRAVLSRSSEYFWHWLKSSICKHAYSNIYASSKPTTCWIANPLLCYHRSVCDVMVTLLARKQNYHLWQKWMPVQTTFRKFNTFSWSFSLVSYEFRVRDDEEISLDSVLCVGYLVGYGFCGIYERYRRVLWF